MRNQPNRESSGILLNSVTNKYVAEFDLPYRNLVRYVKEIENNWPKLDSHQRDIIKNSLSMFVGYGPTGSPGSPGSPGPTEPVTNAPVTTNKPTLPSTFPPTLPSTQVPDTVTNAPVGIEQFSETIAPTSGPLVTLDMIASYLKNEPNQVPLLLDYLSADEKTGPEMASWCYQNSYYQSSAGLWSLFFFIFFIFLLIGVGAGYNSK
jgi:hypothetical protein